MVRENASIFERLEAELMRLMAEPLAAGLHLVATPIGHLGDMSLRAVATLARADTIYCEDTRHSAKLLARYGIAQPLESYHEHNGARMRPRILARIAAGRPVALISDAGMPLISDPGFKLVRAVRAAGHPVYVVPGPSAALAGLVVSGIAGEHFYFEGFLPAKSSKRRKRLGELASVPGALVFFESPARLSEMLHDARAVLGNREAAIAREMTKRHEEVLTGRLDALAARVDEAPPKGEMVVVIAPGPGQATEAGDREIENALDEALLHMSVRDAVDAVSARLGVARRRVYGLALARRKGME